MHDDARSARGGFNHNNLGAQRSDAQGRENKVRGYVSASERIIEMRIFKAGTKIIKLDRTIVMGILNVTPDSFSDGGKHADPTEAVNHARLMKEQGADIIDIGGQSTRPGYTKLPPEAEWARIEPVLKALKNENLIISVDTFYPEVARKAVELGVDIINDITGFCNPEMIKAAKESGAGCIVMHSEEIEQRPNASEAVFDYLKNKTDEMVRAGIEPDSICVDPGIGFGKTYEQNLELVKCFKKLRELGFATLSAASRKRVIGAPCGNPPFEERDGATIAAHTISIVTGADMIRVHDVKNAVYAARVADAVISAGDFNG